MIYHIQEDLLGMLQNLLQDEENSSIEEIVFCEIHSREVTSVRAQVMDNKKAGSKPNETSDIIPIIDLENIDSEIVDKEKIEQRPNTSEVVPVIDLENEESKEEYKCGSCETSFPDKHSLAQHSFTHRTYTCLFCTKSYGKEYQLKAHQEYIHSNSHLLICDTCKKGFKRKLDLQIHVLAHIGEKPYIRECKKVFTKLSRLKVHAQIQTTEVPIQSQIRSIANLKRNVLHEKVELRTHDCKGCGLSYNEKRCFERHACILENNTSQTCKQCRKHFETVGDLKFHLGQHTTYKNNKLQCPFCKMLFRFSENLRKHIPTHGGYLPFKCSECGKGFHDRSSFCKHQLKHTSGKNHTIDSGVKSYTREKDIKSHSNYDKVKTNTSDSEIKTRVNENVVNPCIDNGAKPYINYNSITNTESAHKLFVEGDEQYHVNKLFSFSKRNKTLTRIPSLAVHTLKCLQEDQTASKLSDKTSKTLNKFSFQCPECHMDFLSSVDLKMHAGQNHGRFYSCDLCQDTFPSICSLKAHRESFHEPTMNHETMFVCDLCKNGFRSKGDLSKHVLVHIC